MVSGEITIGSGINSGRIDIVGKTIDGEYHGYEVKNTGLSAEQLNRYINSGFFDKVYHCSRVGPKTNDIIENESTSQNSHRILLDLRTELSNGIAADQYSESEVIDTVRETIGERAWNGKLRGFGQVNNRLLDESEKLVKSFFTSNLGIPTVDFNPNKTYVDLDTAANQLETEIPVPTEIGIIQVQVPINDHFDESENIWLAPNPNEDWRAELGENVLDVFSTSNVNEIEIIRDAPVLVRESQPSLPRTNEAWVNHYIWHAYGTIREAVVPCPDENTIRRVDIMRFEGADTPTGTFQNADNAEIIGIEAKGVGAIGTKTADTRVREQLYSYLKSGCLTRVYLAVPTSAYAKALTVLDVSETNPISDIGLITVNEQGKLTFVKEAQQRRQRFDGYIKEKGNKEYTRSIGYGRVKPLEETMPKSPCRIRSY